jgi:hypothetical protein
MNNDTPNHKPSDLEQAARRALARYDNPQEPHNTEAGGFPRGEIAWAMAADLRPVLEGLEMPIRRADVRAAFEALRAQIRCLPGPGDLGAAPAATVFYRVVNAAIEKIDETAVTLGIELEAQ